MSTNYKTLYLNDTFKLAKTLVIKSEDSIEKINELIRLKYGNLAVDNNDPSSWKYYLNISGEYHFTDEVMTVTSLDTLEIIYFNKENLAIHTATKDAYQFGTRYYYSLINRYPEQEQLILGILNPVDIDHGITAEDGSVLAYAKSLIEKQEVTLIQELETWIKKMLVRWHVKSFTTSDSLYSTAQHALLYLNLVPKILNLRLKRCKTLETHSFHIREYLASHGKLDRFLPFLTTKQALFLYRNINYLERHSGQSNILYWLIDRLLTERYIPISEFSMRHYDEFDDNYYTNFLFKKKALNPEINVPEKDFYNLTELLRKEEPDALWNKDFSESDFDVIDLKFKNSMSSVVQTKVLESSIVDYSDSYVYKLIDTLIQHWGYMSAKGLYHVMTHFKNPKTGELQSLYADDAFIYMLYITAKAIGSNLDRIPEYIVLRVLRNPRPTVNTLMSVVDKTIVRDTTEADWLIRNQPIMTPCYSQSAFYDLCYSIFEAENKQVGLISNQQNEYRRGLIYNMVCQLYSDEKIHFPDEGMLYVDWLREKGLDDTDFSLSECLTLITEITYKSTGYFVDATKVVKNIQKAMISILKQLSSYSIQVLDTANESAIIPLNWGAIRVGQSDVSGKNNTLSDIVNARILELNGSQFAKLDFDVKPPSFDPEFSEGYKVNQKATYETMFDVKPRTQQAFSYVVEANMNIGQMTFSVDYPGKVTSSTPGSTFIGFEYYLNLSDDEKRTIPDIYHGTLDLDYKDPNQDLIDTIINNTI